MTQSVDVVVIGLGGMGSATLFNLAKRGVRVAGLEQFEINHDKGSSHGESRAIRLSYFEHPSYVPLLQRAFESWREFGELCGEEIMTATGILEVGHPGNALVTGSLKASQLHGLQHETFDGAGVNKRFPMFTVPAHWEALFQPQGGFVRPEPAIRNYVALAQHHGATVRTNTPVLAIEPTANAVLVRTADETFEAGSVVVSAGAWIGELAPVLKPHLTVTRQVIGWFEPLDPAPFRLGSLPTFLLRSEDESYYCFPNFSGAGVKAGCHYPSGVLDRAGDLQQDAGPADEARIRRLFSNYMPGANGPLNQMRTCLYTWTPDEDFIIDRASADPRIVLASPCSGHGYKFASVMGEVLADLAEGKTPPFDLSRFTLDRFAAGAMPHATDEPQ